MIRPLISLLALALAGPTAAQVGMLDPTFDTDGVLSTDFDEEDLANGIALLPDGGIVVAGTSAEIGVPNTRRARATAYDAAGQILWASAFGHSVAGCGSVPTAFNDVLREPDGNLLAAGYAQFDCDGPQRDFWIHRLSPAGASQELFERPVFGGQFEMVQALARYPDGRVVAAGVAGSINNLSTYDVAVALYQPDGSLDDTFGTDGEFTLDVSGDQDSAIDVALQPDGRILLAGYRTLGDQRDGLIVRLTTEGALDPTFGVGGVVTYDFAGFHDVAAAIAVQQDGRIVVAGSRTEADGVSTRFTAHRYLSDGSLDASFGAGGMAAVDFAGRPAGAAGIVLQPDNRIVLAGWAETGDGGPESRQFAIARLEADGSLDPAFAGDGRQTADVTDGADIGRALAIQPDGNLVITGYAEFEVEGALQRDWALARFIGDAPTGVETPADADVGDRLQGPSPNPVRSGALVHYEMAEAGPVRLVLLDAIGRELTALVDAVQPAGRHEAALDVRGLRDGVYVLRMITGRGTEARRFTVAR